MDRPRPSLHPGRQRGRPHAEPLRGPARPVDLAARGPERSAKIVRFQHVDLGVGQDPLRIPGHLGRP